MSEVSEEWEMAEADRYRSLMDGEIPEVGGRMEHLMPSQRLP